MLSKALPASPAWSASLARLLFPPRDTCFHPRPETAPSGLGISLRWRWISFRTAGGASRTPDVQAACDPRWVAPVSRCGPVPAALGWIQRTRLPTADWDKKTSEAGNYISQQAPRLAGPRPADLSDVVPRAPESFRASPSVSGAARAPQRAPSPQPLRPPQGRRGPVQGWLAGPRGAGRSR